MLKLTMSVKRFPAQSSTATALSPFTVTSSSLKFDTRARGRYANIKIENDASSESWRFGTIKLRYKTGWKKIMAENIINSGINYE